MSDILKQRQESHGDAWTTAIAYNRDNVLAYPLDMIKAKLARIASGNQMFEDHYVDIVGYAQMARGFIQRIERAVK